MQVHQVLSNPILGYRLDPGEPGVLRASSARDSTRAVTSQELHNIYRLQSQAFMEGKVVVYAHISYSKAFSGSYLATTSGLTTVVSVPGPHPLTDIRIATNATRSGASHPIKKAGEKQPEGQAPTQPPGTMPSSQELPPSNSNQLLQQEASILAVLRKLDHEMAEGQLRDPFLEQKRIKALRALMEIEQQRFFRTQNPTAQENHHIPIDLIV